MRLPRIAFSLFTLVLFAWCRTGFAQERITVGLTTRTGSTSLPFVIAEEKGFFKSEGLNGIVVIMQNQVVVNGVVTRNVDYGGTFSFRRSCALQPACADCHVGDGRFGSLSGHEHQHQTSRRFERQKI